MPATAAEHGLRAASFVIRHAVAAAVVIGGVLLFTAVSYFGLLLWAVLAGEPLGGPIALPFVLLLACAASIAIVFVLFLVTASAEALCSRLLHWHWVAQVPVSMLLLALFLVGGGLLFGGGEGASDQSAVVLGAIATAVLLVPLGAYFWSMRSTGWLLGLGGRAFERVRIRLVSGPRVR